MTAWSTVTQRVRRVIETRLGSTALVQVHEGSGSDLAATLCTTSGLVFVKAVDLRSPQANIRRIEARAAAHLPPETGAPRLRWYEDDGTWLVMCFEHVAGRHADLSPGSPDLPMVAQRLDTLSRVETSSLAVLPADRRWAPFGSAAELKLLTGCTPVHTDLVAANILIGRQARFIDWAWPTMGAAWLDTALMVPALILAGNTPADAERWAAQVPAFAEVPAEAIDACVRIRLAFARDRRASTLCEAVRAWLEHRVRLAAGS